MIERVQRGGGGRLFELFLIIFPADNPPSPDPDGGLRVPGGEQSGRTHVALAIALRARQSGGEWSRVFAVVQKVREVLVRAAFRPRFQWFASNIIQGLLSHK